MCCRTKLASSKETGADNDFTITGGNTAGINALSKLGLNVDSDATLDTYKMYAKYADGGEHFAAFFNLSDETQTIHCDIETLHVGDEPCAHKDASLTESAVLTTVKSRSRTFFSILVFPAHAHNKNAMIIHILIRHIFSAISPSDAPVRLFYSEVYVK